MIEPHTRLDMQRLENENHETITQKSKGHNDMGGLMSSPFPWAKMKRKFTAKMGIKMVARRKPQASITPRELCLHLLLCFNNLVDAKTYPYMRSKKKKSGIKNLT